MNNHVLSYSIWLTPSEKDQFVLLGIIERLAIEYQTPYFMPHITLCAGDTENGFTALCYQVELLCRTLHAKFLRVNNIGQADNFFQFLYLTFVQENDPDLLRFVQLLPKTSFPQIGLHLSLMYSDLFSKIDRKIARQLISDRMPYTIVFDCIQVVSPHTGNWRDIDSWEIICAFTLKSWV